MKETEGTEVFSEAEDETEASETRESKAEASEDTEDFRGLAEVGLDSGGSSEPFCPV